MATTARGEFFPMAADGSLPTAIGGSRLSLDTVSNPYGSQKSQKSRRSIGVISMFADQSRAGELADGGELVYDMYAVTDDGRLATGRRQRSVSLYDDEAGADTDGLQPAEFAVLPVESITVPARTTTTVITTTGGVERDGGSEGATQTTGGTKKASVKKAGSFHMKSAYADDAAESPPTSANTTMQMSSNKSPSTSASTTTQKSSFTTSSTSVKATLRSSSPAKTDQQPVAKPETPTGDLYSRSTKQARSSESATNAARKGVQQPTRDSVNNGTHSDNEANGDNGTNGDNDPSPNTPEYDTLDSNVSVSTMDAEAFLSDVGSSLSSVYRSNVSVGKEPGSFQINNGASRPSYKLTKREERSETTDDGAAGKVTTDDRPNVTSSRAAAPDALRAASDAQLGWKKQLAYYKSSEFRSRQAAAAAPTPGSLVRKSSSNRSNDAASGSKPASAGAASVSVVTTRDVVVKEADGTAAENSKGASQPLSPIQAYSQIGAESGRKGSQKSGKLRVSTSGAKPADQTSSPARHPPSPTASTQVDEIQLGLKRNNSSATDVSQMSRDGTTATLSLSSLSSSASLVARDAVDEKPASATFRMKAGTKRIEIDESLPDSQTAVARSQQFRSQLSALISPKLEAGYPPVSAPSSLARDRAAGGRRQAALAAQQGGRTGASVGRDAGAQTGLGTGRETRQETVTETGRETVIATERETRLATGRETDMEKGITTGAETGPVDTKPITVPDIGPDTGSDAQPISGPHTFPRYARRSGGDRPPVVIVSPLPLSPQQEISETVKEGTVGQLVKDIFRDLPLTGGCMDATTATLKRRDAAATGDAARGASPAPGEATDAKTFRFLVEGIDTPDVERDDVTGDVTTTKTGDASAGRSAEVGEPSPTDVDSIKRTLEKRGLRPFIDMKLASEIKLRAEGVTARRPHEAVEERTSQQSQAKAADRADSLVLLNARHSLLKQPPGGAAAGNRMSQTDGDESTLLREAREKLNRPAAPVSPSSDLIEQSLALQDVREKLHKHLVERHKLKTEEKSSDNESSVGETPTTTAGVSAVSTMSENDRTTHGAASGDEAVEDRSPRVTGMAGRSTTRVIETAASSTDVTGRAVGSTKAVGSTIVTDKAVGSTYVTRKAIGSTQATDKAVDSTKADNSAQVTDKAVGSTYVTGKALGSTQVTDKAVSSAQVTDKAVSSAEVTDTTVGSAQVTDEAVGSTYVTGKAVGSTQVTDKAVSSAQVTDKAVSSAEVTDKTVGSAQVTDEAVGSTYVTGKALGSTQVTDKAVSSAQVTDKAVSSAQVTDEAVGSTYVAGKAVGSTQVTDKAVSSAQVTDKAVSSAEVTDKAVGSAQVTDKAVGAGQVTEKTVSSLDITYKADSSPHVTDKAVRSTLVTNKAISAIHVTDRTALESSTHVTALIGKDASDDMSTHIGKPLVTTAAGIEDNEDKKYYEYGITSQAPKPVGGDVSVTRSEYIITTSTNDAGHSAVPVDKSVDRAIEITEQVVTTSSKTGESFSKRERNGAESNEREAAVTVVTEYAAGGDTGRYAVRSPSDAPDSAYQSDAAFSPQLDAARAAAGLASIAQQDVNVHLVVADNALTATDDLSAVGESPASVSEQEPAGRLDEEEGEEEGERGERQRDRALSPPAVYRYSGVAGAPAVERRVAAGRALQRADSTLLDAVLASNWLQGRAIRETLEDYGRLDPAAAATGRPYVRHIRRRSSAVDASALGGGRQNDAFQFSAYEVDRDDPDRSDGGGWHDLSMSPTLSTVSEVDQVYYRPRSQQPNGSLSVSIDSIHRGAEPPPPPAYRHVTRVRHEHGGRTAHAPLQPLQIAVNMNAAPAARRERATPPYVINPSFEAPPLAVNGYAADTHRRAREVGGRRAGWQQSTASTSASRHAARYATLSPTYIERRPAAGYSMRTVTAAPRPADHSRRRGQNVARVQLDHPADMEARSVYSEPGGYRTGSYSVQQRQDHIISSPPPPLQQLHPDMAARGRQTTYQVSRENAASVSDLTAIDPQLRDASKDGKNYHITLNLKGHTATRQSTNGQFESVSSFDYISQQQLQQQQQQQQQQELLRYQQQQQPYTLVQQQTRQTVQEQQLLLQPSPGYVLSPSPSVFEDHYDRLYAVQSHYNSPQQYSPGAGAVNGYTVASVTESRQRDGFSDGGGGGGERDTRRSGRPSGGEPPSFTMQVNQTMRMGYTPDEQPHEAAVQQERVVPAESYYVRNVTETARQAAVTSQRDVLTSQRDVTMTTSKRGAVQTNGAPRHHRSRHHHHHNDVDDDDAMPKVVRGNILIKNSIDTCGAPKVIDVVEADDSDDETVIEDNVNPFDTRYLQSRENPMYSSDQDLTTIDSHLVRQQQAVFHEAPPRHHQRTTTTTTDEVLHAPPPRRFSSRTEERVRQQAMTNSRVVPVSTDADEFDTEIPITGRTLRSPSQVGHWDPRAW